jgi:N-methylhydantoinase A
LPARRRNPALGVLDGIARFLARDVRPAEIEFFAHGTTITTNALLEMRGAKVGMLITDGFRAIQEVQTQARDGNLFDYFFSKPQPIAPQSLTKEIPERCDYAATCCCRSTATRCGGRARAQGRRRASRSRSAICSPS